MFKKFTVMILVLFAFSLYLKADRAPDCTVIMGVSVIDKSISVKEVFRLNNGLLHKFLEKNLDLKQFTSKPKYIVAYDDENSLSVYFFTGYPNKGKIDQDFHKKVLKYIKEELGLITKK